MKRSPMPRRTTRLRASGPIRPKKRAPSETRRIYGTPERIEWLKAQPCVVPMCPRRPCECAHVGNGGMGRKSPAALTVPLCPTHHRESHTVGIRSFQARHNIDLLTIAAETEAAWRAHAA